MHNWANAFFNAQCIMHNAQLGYAIAENPVGINYR